MTLTTALALAGLLLLLALGLHGWWQTRRAQPRKAVPGPATTERVEPALGAAEVTSAPLEPVALRMAPRRVPRLDALIDAIVPLALEAPISGEMALAHLPPTRRAGSKPFYVEGLDAESGQWEPFTPGHRYGELQAGVQLASRSGALNEIEYSEFVQKVETFAEAVGASADVPDMLEVAARARELDGLTGPLDAQLTVTLRSNGVAWSVGYVQQVAARLGFVTGAVPGRMVLPAAEEGAPPMLVLSVDPQAPDEARVMRFGAPGQLAGLFGDAGLSQVDETTMSVASQYRDVDELWTSLLAGIGPAGAYAVALPEDTRADLRRALHEQLGSPAGPFTLTALARAARATVP
mgnify:CR=1 FL=1